MSNPDHRAECPNKNEKSPKALEREERVAKQLRANLMRRKMQARGRNKQDKLGEA